MAYIKASLEKVSAIQFRSLTMRLFLSIGSIVFLLVILEMGYGLYRLISSANSENLIPLYIWEENSPEIYYHNVNHPDINHFGFRKCDLDTEASSNKAGPEFRVLFLGDSVTYGHGVSCDRTFSALIETNSRNYGLGVKTYNAGVNGYNTYNEYQSYLSRGRATNPDLVVLVTVLNDFSNPRLHWANEGSNNIFIPEAAIPDVQYDNKHGIPGFNALQKEKRMDSLFVTKIFKKARANYISTLQTTSEPPAQPTHITGEDSYSITRVLSRNSPGLIWYTSIVEKLRAVVEADGANLLVIIIPLSYQVDTAYPYLPQTAILESCHEIGVQCLDPLPEFIKFSHKGLFLGKESGYWDIWHLSQEGHILVSGFLAKFINEFAQMEKSHAP